MPRLTGPTLTVIWWRDIPAQVVAKDGERTARRELHRRFQVAIDRAAVKSGRREMQPYIAEWRKVARVCATDLEAEVHAEVERLEAAHPREVLDGLVANGGLADRSVDGTLPPPPAEPAAG